MKSLIVYSSQSENTKKLADTIYKSLEGEKDIFSVDKAPSTKGYGLILVGFWLMAGKPDPKSSEYLSKLGKDDRLFLFATHGSCLDIIVPPVYERMTVCFSLPPMVQPQDQTMSKTQLPMPLVLQMDQILPVCLPARER